MCKIPFNLILSYLIILMMGFHCWEYFCWIFPIASLNLQSLSMGWEGNGRVPPHSSSIASLNGIKLKLIEDWLQTIIKSHGRVHEPTLHFLTPPPIPLRNTIYNQSGQGKLQYDKKWGIEAEEENFLRLSPTLLSPVSFPWVKSFIYLP